MRGWRTFCGWRGAGGFEHLRADGFGGGGGSAGGGDRGGAGGCGCGDDVWAFRGDVWARGGGGGAEVHGAMMRNMGRLAGVVSGRGGMPLVVPRLLKVRETIPEMEVFFDRWVERCGWAVIDGPTDRAGAVAFKAVVDMGPAKRRACRRIWERMVVRADGTGVACDQDVSGGVGKLRVGNVEGMTIQEMWRGLNGLREMHAAGQWGEIDPCRSCREWHRA